MKSFRAENYPIIKNRKTYKYLKLISHVISVSATFNDDIRVFFCYPSFRTRT